MVGDQFINNNRKARTMKMCCEQTAVANEDIFIFKGESKQHRQKILTRESQVNPLLTHSNERILMFAKSKEEVTSSNGEERKLPFTDAQFGPNLQSLGRYQGRNVQWVRLAQIVTVFVESQYAPDDILALKQGDTYFLASLAALSQIPAIIDQAFDQELQLSSVGAYRLNISIKGKPQQIIIDDYLPVFTDNHQRAAFCHIEPSNLWVVLFQKAYAKIQGSYQKISFGFAHQVLVTFSMSPCLYKLIMTDFRHQQQQKCWKTLLQCVQMKYPTVVGSRKKFTSNAIVPHQSYCLKTCKLVKTRKDQERRVLLWNIPGMQLIQDKGIQYEKEGSIISISLVEFMRNFEVIDIAHVRHNFSSHFYQSKCGPKQPILYAFTTTQKTSLYLTLQRKQGQKGKLRIMLINCTSEATYQFVSGKKEEIYNDVTLHTEKLPTGGYVVICESQNDSSCLLRIYSQRPTPLMKFLGKKDTLLQRTFMELAHASQAQKFALSKEHNDWYLAKILFDELGLAFFAIHLDQKSLLKCQMSINMKQLAEEGMNLINKNTKNDYGVVVKSGQSDILIFEFVGQNNQTFCFPPSSLKIRVVI